MAAEFSNQEKWSGRSRRSVCTTNPSGFPQRLLVPGPAGPAQGVAADRTSAFLLPRAGVDQSLPYMALGTLPPDAAVASGRYHLRRQVSVEGRVPLRRHIRRFCGKIVESGEGFASRTIGAVASAERSGRNHGGVAVAQRTFPPGLAQGARSYLLGRQRGVFLGIPLAHKFRSDICQ